MGDSLETIASRVARLAMRNVPNLGRVGGNSPVVSVVMDTETFEIFVALNQDVPPAMVEALQQSIDAQKQRIALGQVRIVHSDPTAQEGGHSEVCALNAAIRARQARTKRTMTELDLHVFELHNVWLKGSRAGTTAKRCEHCMRMTRGVRVTQSMFVAEGGVVGEITVRPVPVRGMIKRAGAVEPEQADSASGTIGPRGMVQRSGAVEPEEADSASGTINTSRVGVLNAGEEGGGGEGGFMAEGLVTAGIVLAEPLVRRCAFNLFMKDKWNREAQAKLWAAISSHLDKFNVLIASRRADILWAKADNRRVTLHVCVDTGYQATNFGDALMEAEVSNYDLLFDNEQHIEWPVFHNKYWSWFSGQSNGRKCFDFAL